MAAASSKGDGHAESAFRSMSANSSENLEHLVGPGGDWHSGVPQAVSKQTIALQGSDLCNSVSVYGRDVTIIASEASAASTEGSNKVQVSKVVNFDWEVRPYFGRLVAVDKTHTCIASVLKGKAGGIVRLINRRLAERALIKCYSANVVDIAFGFTQDTTLASVDEDGNLFVHKIVDSPLSATLLLHLNYTPSGLNGASRCHRVVWCPFIPEEGAKEHAEDARHLLAVTYDSQAIMVNVSTVRAHHSEWPLETHQVKEGVLEVSSHLKSIVDIAFSPDGTALATASMDGFVKFFQVYMHDKSVPRCLHEWLPHEGKMLSSLFFLDDHKQPNPSIQFWKYAVTGADNNRELKVWSCETWACLQTLRFLPSPKADIEPYLMASTDLSSKHLILSDINRKVLYVLQMHQDETANTAHASGLSEFLLDAPCLSFAVMDASLSRSQKGPGSSSNSGSGQPYGFGSSYDEDNDGGDPFASLNGGEKTPRASLSLIAIQPKALNEMHIVYSPQTSAPLGGSVESSVDTLHVPVSPTADVTITESLLSISSTSISSSSKSVLLPPNSFMLMSPGSSLTRVSALPDTDETIGTMAGSHRASVDSPVPGQSSTTVTVALPHSPLERSVSQTSGGSARSSGQSNSARSNSIDLPAPSAAIASAELSARKASASPASEGDPLRSYGSLPSTVGGVVNHRPASSSETVTKPASPSRETLPCVTLGESTNSSAALSETGYQQDRTEFAEAVQEDSRDRDLGSASATSPLPVTTETSAVIDTVFKEDKSPLSTPDSSQRISAGGAQFDSRSWPAAPILTVQHSASAAGAATGLQALSLSSISSADDDVSSLDDEDLYQQQHLGAGATLLESESHGAYTTAASALPADATIQSINQRPVVRSLPSDLDLESLRELKDIAAHMEQLRRLVEAQGEELRQIKQDVLRPQPAAALPPGHLTQSVLCAQLVNVQMAIAAKVDTVAANNAKRDQQQQQQQQKAITSAVQRASTDARDAIEKTVPVEVKKALAPGLQNMMDSLRKDLSAAVAERLSFVEGVVKEHVGKLISSKQTTDAIGEAVGSIVQGTILTTYRDVMLQALLPSFEASTKKMFQQLNTTFHEGTTEFIRDVSGHADKIKLRQQNMQEVFSTQVQELCTACRDASNELQSGRQQLAAMAVQLQQMQKQTEVQLQRALTSAHATLLSDVRQSIQDELCTALSQHQVALSAQIASALSLAAQSSSVVSQPAGISSSASAGMDFEQYKSQVAILLSRGELNTAFRLALSASDLSKVMYLLKHADTSQVFGTTPCPLQQPVILSLVQQLTQDLENEVDLDVKLGYLQDGIVSLDLEDAITREHCPRVINELCERLTHFIQINSGTPMAKRLKMLLMSAHSLVLRK